MVAGDSALADKPFFGHRRAVEDLPNDNGALIPTQVDGSMAQMGRLAQGDETVKASGRGSIAAWEVSHAVNPIGCAPSA